MPGPITTASDCGASSRASASTWPSIERPAILCSTFGSADFMRVPSPAARTTMSSGRGDIRPRGSGGSGCTVTILAQSARPAGREQISYRPSWGANKTGENCRYRRLAARHALLQSHHSDCRKPFDSLSRASRPSSSTGCAPNSGHPALTQTERLTDHPTRFPGNPVAFRWFCAFVKARESGSTLERPNPRKRKSDVGPNPEAAP